MKNMKRLLALGLSCVLAVSLAGCMSKGNGGSGGKSSSSGEGVPVPEGVFEPYEKEVTLTTVVEENAGIQFQNGDTYDDNTWYRAYKDRFNIEVKNLWVSNDYNTKMNLTIADGSLPDVFRVTGQQLVQLQQSGMIMDLTELFDKYASDRLKSYMDMDKDTYETGRFDGKLFGIPQLNYGIIDQFNYVWIRKDWKEKLGLPDPKSMDEVTALAKSFQENFGGYPITETQTLECMNRLAVAWGAHPGIWLKTADGTLGYGSVQPEMKEVLKVYSQWYADGIINPEFTTYDQAKMFQDMINGETGVCPMAQWMGYYPVPDVVKNLGPDGIFEPYAIPSANGAEVLGNVNFGNRGYIVINKKCKNPEAALKLINFYAYMMDEAAENETPEFITSLFDNAYTNIPFAFNVINPQTDYNQFVKVTDALKKGTAVDVTSLGKDATKYQNCVKWINDKEPSSVGDWLQQGNDKSAYRIAKDYVDNNKYVKNAIWGLTTDTLLNSGSTLDDILAEGFTKIIVGEESVDYFDTLVKSWEKAGGAKATEEVNEVYGKN